MLPHYELPFHIIFRSAEHLHFTFGGARLFFITLVKSQISRIYPTKLMASHRIEPIAGGHFVNAHPQLSEKGAIAETNRAVNCTWIVASLESHKFRWEYKSVYLWQEKYFVQEGEAVGRFSLVEWDEMVNFELGLSRFFVL